MTEPDPRTPSRRRWLIICGGLYLVMVCVVVWGMFAARSSMLSRRNSADLVDEWDEWVAAASEQAGDVGPVQRRAPESALPPWVILLEDHFAVCLVGLLAMSSGLFVTLAFFAVGVFRAPKTDIHDG